MPFLFIPPLGTELTLATDWTFALHDEYRNSSLKQAMDIQFKQVAHWLQNDQFEMVTLPAGLIVKVDRIYIRSGQSGFDSVTFSVAAKHAKKQTWPNGRFNGALRFWVKLDDANKLEFAVDNSTPIQKEVAAKLLKMSARVTAPVNALTKASEYVLETLVTHGTAAFDFNIMELKEFHPEFLAIILRSTSTFRLEICGWAEALKVCAQICEDVNLNPYDVLYGMVSDSAALKSEKTFDNK